MVRDGVCGCWEMDAAKQLHSSASLVMGVWRMCLIVRHYIVIQFDQAGPKTHRPGTFPDLVGRARTVDAWCHHAGKAPTPGPPKKRQPQFPGEDTRRAHHDWPSESPSDCDAIHRGARASRAHGKNAARRLILKSSECEVRQKFPSDQHCLIYEKIRGRFCNYTKLSFKHDQVQSLL